MGRRPGDVKGGHALGDRSEPTDVRHDTGHPDTGHHDTGQPDTGHHDTGYPDTGHHDTGYPDRAHPELRDEVDELVGRWRAERPDLDVAPLQVLSRVSRLARHLDRARTAAFAAHGLQAWEFDVLSALRRQGPPYQLSPGALLRATLVTSGTMTNRIDRLADAGLVSRRPDPADKRGVLVTLTARGRDVAGAALADLLASDRELLTGLDAPQQRGLPALLRILLAPFDASQAPDSARA